MSTPTSGWLPWVGMGVAVFLAGWGWLRYRQARSRLEAALAHSTASRQQVVDNIPDGFLRVDRDGVILEANGVLLRMFGYSQAELLGQKVEKLVPERLRERHVVNRAGYDREATVRHMGSGLELFGRHADGHAVPVELHRMVVMMMVMVLMVLRPHARSYDDQEQPGECPSDPRAQRRAPRVAAPADSNRTSNAIPSQNNHSRHAGAADGCGSSRSWPRIPAKTGILPA